MSTSSSSNCCCSLVPASTATTTLLFFISCGFLTRVILRCEGGVSLTPNHKLVDQSSVFMSPGDRVVELHPWTLGIHFSHLLQYAWTTLVYSCSRSPPGNEQIIILLTLNIPRGVLRGPPLVCYWLTSVEINKHKIFDTNNA